MLDKYNFISFIILKKSHLTIIKIKCPCKKNKEMFQVNINMVSYLIRFFFFLRLAFFYWLCANNDFCAVFNCRFRSNCIEIEFTKPITSKVCAFSSFIVFALLENNRQIISISKQLSLHTFSFSFGCFGCFYFNSIVNC